jgi:hypothetical protein
LPDVAIPITRIRSWRMTRSWSLISSVILQSQGLGATKAGAFREPRNAPAKST